MGVCYPGLDIGGFNASVDGPDVMVFGIASPYSSNVVSIASTFDVLAWVLVVLTPELVVLMSWPLLSPALNQELAPLALDRLLS
ncbi:hypothetical protein AMTR_s00023p00207280 [Amborella trichopoda]|uniref:Uncharacterized protein n=1 Tax=Amborella trichopoda TaxID=13333 RepID=W1NKE8_AMBTC|nr:hypothetical protein AMTR_s00023p00207280 [Amborella trichopoda]